MVRYDVLKSNRIRAVPVQAMSLRIDVGLVSGRTVSLEVQADASVASLNQCAQTALGVGKGRLLNSNGQVLDRLATLQEAGLENGAVLTLHVQQVQLAASKKGDAGLQAAFAAILGDGSVVTLGFPVVPSSLGLPTKSNL